MSKYKIYAIASITVPIGTYVGEEHDARMEAHRRLAFLQKKTHEKFAKAGKGAWEPEYVDIEIEEVISHSSE